MIVGGVVILVVLLALLAMSVHVVQPDERGVVFRCGRCKGVRGPGCIWLVPVMEQMMTFTMRPVANEIPALTVVIQNNIPIKITLIVHARVIDPMKAIVEGKPYVFALRQRAQAVLQAVIGQYGLVTVLEERKMIQAAVLAALSPQTDRWGVLVSHVEIKDIDLPFEVQCALAAINSPEWKAEWDTRNKECGRMVSL